MVTDRVAVVAPVDIGRLAFAESVLVDIAHWELPAFALVVGCCLWVAWG